MQVSNDHTYAATTTEAYSERDGGLLTVGTIRGRFPDLVAFLQGCEQSLVRARAWFGQHACGPAA